MNIRMIYGRAPGNHPVEFFNDIRKNYSGIFRWISKGFTEGTQQDFYQKFRKKIWINLSLERYLKLSRRIFVCNLGAFQKNLRKNPREIFEKIITGKFLEKSRRNVQEISGRIMESSKKARRNTSEDSQKNFLYLKESSKDIRRILTGYLVSPRSIRMILTKQLQ